MVTNSLVKTSVGRNRHRFKTKKYKRYRLKVLQESIFPDAKPQSILMAIDYCKVRI